MTWIPMYEVHMISFQTFFRMDTFIDSTHMKFYLLRSNLLRLQCTCSTVPTTSERPHRRPLVWACQWPSSQPLSSPQLSHNDSLWFKGITKSHKGKVSTIGRLRNCLADHLGQIVCDKDGGVDWCIILVEMLQTRFEDCWPLPTESLPELP